MYVEQHMHSRSLTLLTITLKQTEYQVEALLGCQSIPYIKV